MTKTVNGTITDAVTQIHTKVLGEKTTSQNAGEIKTSDTIADAISISQIQTDSKSEEEEE